MIGAAEEEAVMRGMACKERESRRRSSTRRLLVGPLGDIIGGGAAAGMRGMDCRESRRSSSSSRKSAVKPKAAHSALAGDARDGL